MYDYTFKLCIFGDGGVGKTTLTTRFLKSLFKPSMVMTVGTNFYNKIVEIDGKSIGLQIWDFGGEKQYRDLFPSYIRGANSGLFMFDITRYSSLKNVDEWIEALKEGIKDPLPIILVGGKNDLEENRIIEKETAEEVVKRFDFLDYIECSAKTGYNVEEIFFRIAKLMKDNVDKKEKSKS